MKSLSGKSASTTQIDGPGVEKLRGDLEQKLSFHENRWMCLTQPASATRCLGAVAHLEVTVVKAKDLIPNETTGLGTFLSPPETFVRVYLDDTEVYETGRAKSTSHPVFNQECKPGGESIGVTAVRSIVRFHIYDKDIEDEGARDVFAMNVGDVSVANGKASSALQHALGFVEVCLADMPFDEEITGWLELRFPAHLQGTNKKRYEQHCRVREDVLHKEMAELFGDDSNRKGTEFVQMSKQVGPKMSKSPSMMKSVMGRIRKDQDTGTGDSSATQQFNAGELLVKMKLVRATPLDSDIMFSYALHPPALAFNPIVQEDALPEFDIQELFDDAMDVKFAVVDDFVLCFASYVWYLLSWNNQHISGPIILCLLLTCWSQPLIMACIYGILAALLVMNCREALRQQMTTSGLNAPLTNEGFLTVARWNSILQMETFLYRVMMHQGGQVLNERALHDFVATGFRELLDPSKGFEEDDTSLTLPDIVRVMKGMDWCSLQGKDLDDELIKVGSMVRIHERRRATVSSVLPAENGDGRKRYVVHYDELEGHEAEEECETLYEEQLHVRTLIPRVPKYLLSSKIKENFRKVAWQIDYGKRSAILPALQFISDVVTWKIAWVAGLIVAFFVLNMVMSLISFFEPGEFLTDVIWISKHIGHYVFVAVVIISFLVFAQPLAWIIAAAKMLKEWFSSKRAAPDMWPFFTPLGNGEEDVLLDVATSPRGAKAEDDNTAGTVPLLKPGSGAKRSCLPCFRPPATRDT